jgi:predicted  nucleic acid-binding Zn-ribbon protein
MGNRKIRERMESLMQRIDEHQAKIAREQERLDPNVGLIQHWEREIRAFSVQVQRYEARLNQRRRRGR